MIKRKQDKRALARALLTTGFGILLYVQASTAVAGVARDNATTKTGSKVTINVTKNDSGYNEKNFSIRIVSGPKQGSANVTGSKQIVYTPKAGFTGTDSLMYRLSDNRGFSKKTTVTIKVTGSSSGSSGAKRANDDNATTSKGTKVTVDVAKNDSGYNKNNYKVAIVGKPKKGKASIQGGKRIVYTPNGQFVGTDVLEYRLTDNRGFNKRAKLRIKVSANASANRGSDSAGGNRIILRWSRNQKQVDGYVVLFGTQKNKTLVEVADISTKKGTLDQNSPSVVLYVESDLGLRPGDNACFSVQAYNKSGYSKASNAVCKRL